MAFAAIILTLTACAPRTENAQTRNAITSPEQCAHEKLVLKQLGKLTIGVERPPLEPWFIEANPANGRGFEAALAYKIASLLGFEKEQVTWVDQVFVDVISSAPKPWDFDINEFTITEERRRVVDFSDPYYENDQAILIMDRTLNDKKIKPTLDDLRKLKLGAQVDTTSFKAAQALRPAAQVAAYDKHEDVQIALTNGQIDGMVTDSPTAMLAFSRIPNTQVFARLVRDEKLPAEAAKRERFGIVLEKGSPLLPCVNWAIQELRVKGEIEKLQELWLRDVDTLPRVTLPKSDG